MRKKKNKLQAELREVSRTLLKTNKVTISFLNSQFFL